MWLFHILKELKNIFKHWENCCALSLTAPSGQDERVHDQTVLSAAHPHPARPRNPQTAVVDPQDGSLPSAALSSQMPKGNDPVLTLSECGY